MIERTYGLNLHQQWKTRLPDDFIIVIVYIQERMMNSLK